MPCPRTPDSKDRSQDATPGSVIAERVHSTSEFSSKAEASEELNNLTNNTLP